VGFGIDDLSSFDPDSAEYAPIWSPPRFDAPQLGLTAATAGEIVVATCSLYGQEPSLNRIYFNLAAGEQGDDALSLWLACLQTGDAMAHFGLGYTLYELGAASTRPTGTFAITRRFRPGTRGTGAGSERPRRRSARPPRRAAATSARSSSRRLARRKPKRWS
jgi:hypothetical protein